MIQWQRFLRVVAEAGPASLESDVPPMAGRYAVTSDAVTFVPSFPLVAGISYRAAYRAEAGLGGLAEVSEGLVANYVLPAPADRPPTRVTAVFPSSAVLPENLLKFYVCFSGPMSRGRIYEHIDLREESGRLVDLPFLELDEELWDPTMTRLTLFLDPGRIKRGVRPLEELGPALEAGRRYTLAIGRQCQDAAGRPLQADFAKSFQVGPPDRQPPDLREWKILPPKAAGRIPLTVTFSEPLDYALAQRVIQVRDQLGRACEGNAGLSEGERQWTFVPFQAWQAGAYEIWVWTGIEDLAGNNIGKPFEVDLFETVTRSPSEAIVKRPFIIAP